MAMESVVSTESYLLILGFVALPCLICDFYFRTLKWFQFRSQSCFCNVPVKCCTLIPSWMTSPFSLLFLLDDDEILNLIEKLGNTACHSLIVHVAIVYVCDCCVICRWEGEGTSAGAPSTSHHPQLWIPLGLPFKPVPTLHSLLQVAVTATGTETLLMHTLWLSAIVPDSAAKESDLCTGSVTCWHTLCDLVCWYRTEWLNKVCIGSVIYWHTFCGLVH